MIELTADEKGALLLNNLAPAVVAKILARLEPERRTRLRLQMANVKQRPEALATLATLIDELNRLLVESTAPKPGTETANPERPSATALARVMPGSAGGLKNGSIAKQAESADQDPRAVLAQLDPERLARVLSQEGARTGALALSLMDVGQAGAVYKLLGPDMRNEITVQFSAQTIPNLAIVSRLVLAIAAKCAQLADQPKLASDIPRPRQMADLLRVLNKTDRLKVLETLESKTPEVAAEVKGLLYRFEDALRVENRSMQKVLMETDAKSLSVALYGAADNVKEKFLTNLSKRAQENLREEMEMLQSVPKEQVEQAQQAVVAVIQRLDLAGELVMSD